MKGLHCCRGILYNDSIPTGVIIKMMKLFQKKEKHALPAYSLTEYEPVIRSSICTGERVACMRSLESGKLHEIMLIRSDADLEEFCLQYSVKRESIKTIY